METHSKHFFSSIEQNQRIHDSDLILVCDHFSTPENIGSIIRLAANVNASKVIVVGSKECRASKVKKTAGAALGHITVEYCSAEEWYRSIPDSYEIIGLETVQGAQDVFKVDLPLKMVLVLGNEKYGISEGLLKNCKVCVYIPMLGPIKSMNVSHAASVCMFEWLRQQML